VAFLKAQHVNVHCFSIIFDRPYYLKNRATMKMFFADLFFLNIATLRALSSSGNALCVFTSLHTITSMRLFR